MIGVDTTFLVQLALRETPQHAQAEILLEYLLSEREVFAVAPQVISEFLHIATDPRRFEHPLHIAVAYDEAEKWWHATEVHHVFPTTDSTTLFLAWLREHHLGRKRLLDTQLAATLWTAGVRRIISSNVRDFRPFGFEVLTP